MSDAKTRDTIVEKRMRYIERMRAMKPESVDVAEGAAGFGEGLAWAKQSID